MPSVIAAVLAVTFASMPCASAVDERIAVRPSPAHLKFHEREIMALVHWGLNQYTGQEWGFGNTSVSRMTAPSLDPRQWVRAMKEAEIKSVVLVAKHHDGFCLWPSKYNRDYSMAAVPAPNTGRDIVRELSDACREEGLEFGVYLSPWDRRQGSYGTARYVDYFFAQWEELLGNYGDICEIWLDGANGGTGWYGGINGDKGERRSIPEGYYRRPELLEMMCRRHPLAVAFGGDGKNSVGWCGNESGSSPETWWCPRRTKDGKMYWIPSEADFPLRRGWFYHPDQKPKSLAHLVKIYYETVGRGAVMNIGIAPDGDGLVCGADEKRLAEFGRWVREFNAVDLAFGAEVEEKRVGNSLTVELRLPRATVVNCVDLKERITEGQRVSMFKVEHFGNSGWEHLAGGRTIGYRRLARFADTEVKRLRVTFSGIAPPQILPVALRRAREVKSSDVAAADTYPKRGWKMVSPVCSSSAGGKICTIDDNAIDGNYYLAWHPHPPQAEMRPPQSVSVDCGRVLTMHGFDYTPRLDGVKRGVVDAYRFFVSSDGEKWEKVSEGEFGNIEANTVKQRVTFEKPVKARYFRFLATHAVAGNDFVAIAEIDIW